VSEIIESGTWLDEADVAGFGRLALPGVDEMMAVLRLSELAAGTARVVVDTAPTGHMLRLLDAGDVHEGIARTLRAMAAKADAVAGAMTGRAVRMRGESIIDELEASVRVWREDVLRRAAFVVVTRPDAVVGAETAQLLAGLEQRRLRVAAVLGVGAAPEGAGDVLRLRGRLWA
jgi:anion-transporting  ArsA/GET3 family ATPase